MLCAGHRLLIRDCRNRAVLVQLIPGTDTDAHMANGAQHSGGPSLACPTPHHEQIQTCGVKSWLVKNLLWLCAMLLEEEVQLTGHDLEGLGLVIVLILSLRRL